MIYYSIRGLIHMSESLNSPSVMDEIAIALKKSKHNKAAGINEIAVEFYKYRTLQGES